MTAIGGIEMSASTKCPHTDLHFDLNTVSFGDSNIKSVEIKAKCNVCQMPMVFFGLPLGMSLTQPTASLGGHEVRLPMCGEQDVPQYPASGVTGFSIKDQA